MLIAASDLTDAEVRAFFVQAENMGVSDCARRIKQLRDGAEGYSDFVERATSRSSHDQDRLEEYKSTIEKVRGLLLDEAKLPKTRAARALYSDLLESGVPRVHLPNYKKIAFDLWIARLCEDVPPSHVLHVASKLRNDLVHGKRSPSNWPLSEPDE